MTSPAAPDLTGPSAELVLRYTKHRWRRDVEDLLAESAGERLRWDDIDLDTDWVELERAVGNPALSGVAQAVLDLRAPLPADHPARAALGPELEGAQAQAFLHLVGLELAFRLRTTPLLQALCAWTAEGPAPRLAPRDLGALLIRARSARAVAGLLTSAPLSPAAREQALAAATPPPPPPPGSRLHVQADHEAVVSALVAALGGRLHAGGATPPGARQFLLLRPRGGFVTVLEEGDAAPAALAAALAARPGISRVAWAAFPGPEGSPALDLRLAEGRRQTLDGAGLASRIGAALEPEDVAGELRALGVLDLDPGHAKGRVELRWLEATRERPRGARRVAVGA